MKGQGLKAGLVGYERGWDLCYEVQLQGARDQESTDRRWWVHVHKQLSKVGVVSEVQGTRLPRTRRKGRGRRRANPAL